MIPMNLIEVIERNHFLKQLFPSGIESFFIGQVELSCFDRINLTLHTNKQPAIEVKKWGIWGEEYNIVTLNILVTSIKSINIENWQNNLMEICTVHVGEPTGGIINLLFEGKNWKAEMKAGMLTYQNSSVYMIEE